MKRGIFIIVQIILLSGMTVQCGKKPQEQGKEAQSASAARHGKARQSVKPAGGEGDGEAKESGDAAAGGKKTSSKPGKDGVKGRDILRPFDKVELGAAGGGRFVDFRRPSGLWAVLNESVKSSPPSPESSRAGVALGVQPITVRLFPGDIGEGRVVLVVQSAGPSEVSWRIKRGGKKKVPLRGGIKLLAIDKAHTSDLDSIDLLVSGGPSDRPPFPSLLGLWLWQGDGDPPAGPPSIKACKNNKGIALEPGQKLIAADVLPRDAIVEARASGGGAGRMKIEIIGDETRTGPHAFSAAAPGLDEIAAMETKAGNKQPEAVEIEVALPGGGGPGACVETISIRPGKAGGGKSTAAGPIEGAVLVMTDTMRGDLYDWYGGYRDKDMAVPMPNLEALAARSYRFTRATAHASYTKPSVATMLSGLYPAEHGALGRSRAMSPNVSPLMHYLSPLGVKSTGVLSNYFFLPRFGMDRGWDSKVWIESFKASIDDQNVLDGIKDMLSSGSLEPPFFLYIHLMGAHVPYSPPAYAKERIARHLLSTTIKPMATTSFIKDFQRGVIKKISKTQLGQLVGLYRSDALYHDDIMGGLTAMLEEAGIMDRALLIYTSDHGEEFLEHGGLGHGRSLWPEQVDVPLLVHLPGQAAGRDIEELAGHIDIAPTILKALGAEPPAFWPGKSLLDIIAGPGGNGQESRGMLLQHWTGARGVKLENWKLITAPGSDPVMSVEKNGRNQELAPQDGPVTLRLLRKKEAFLICSRAAAEPRDAKQEQEAGGEEAEIDEETRKQLEKLGY
ncbi:MAG: sulfatase, partial [Pseudomonadota bacterium]